MDIRFYIDPETNLPHIYKHMVSELEVYAVFENQIEDRKGSNNTRVLIGQTDGGKFLRVIYLADSDGDGLFVITAFELSGKPLKALKKRKRKK